MATVRKYRGRRVADFRDQNGRRRIEAPKGPFETSEFEKRAANELLQQRLAEVTAHTFTPGRQRLTFQELAGLWLENKVNVGKSTIDDYNTMLDCYLLPYFANRRIEAIHAWMLSAFAPR